MGTFFVLVGPSGAGKTTILEELKKRQVPNLTFPVGYTTREPRPGEVNGKNYHFVSKETYDKMVAAGDMVGANEVHGNFYATAKSSIDYGFAFGNDVVGILDVQGTYDAMEKIENTVVVFITASYPELSSRLRERGGKDLDVRLKNLEYEMLFRDWDACFSTDNLTVDESVDELINIINWTRSQEAIGAA